MDKKQNLLTQEEVNKFLAQAPEIGRVLADLGRQHAERGARIDAIASKLSTASDETLQRVERMMGLRPLPALPWYARWQVAAVLFALMATWRAISGNIGEAILVLVLGGIAIIPLALLQTDSKGRER